MNEPLEFFDTHCHLSARYLKSSVSEVIENAREHGVTRMTVIGCGPTIEETVESVEIARAHDGVFAAVGLHPHEAKSWTSEMGAAIEELSRDPKVVAIGETGLDYFYDLSPRDAQEEAFRAQIAIAQRLDLPLIIHNRGSDEDCIRILQDCCASGMRGVVHCYTSGPELARCALDLGFHIGFTGIITFKNAEEVRDILRMVPLDRIVIETDSPFLAPTPYRGKTNQPAYVAHVAAGVAKTLGLSLSEVAERTTHNALTLYGLLP